jgi:hypothetical protein
VSHFEVTPQCRSWAFVAWASAMSSLCSKARQSSLVASPQSRGSGVGRDASVAGIVLVAVDGGNGCGLPRFTFSSVVHEHATETTTTAVKRVATLEV